MVEDVTIDTVDISSVTIDILKIHIGCYYRYYMFKYSCCIEDVTIEL